MAAAIRLLSFSMITGALAIAAIVIVQGAGVAEAAPNPGNAPSSPETTAGSKSTSLRAS
jgi:sulfate permease, SulP family